MEQNIIPVEPNVIADEVFVDVQPEPAGDLTPAQDEQQEPTPKPTQEEKEQYKFAEMSKQNKEYKELIAQSNQAQDERDAFYAKEAAKAGTNFAYITTEKQYREALAKKDAETAQREHGVQLYMTAEGIERNQAEAKYDLSQMNKPQQYAQPTASTIEQEVSIKVNDITSKDINDFNTEFGKTLSSYDDISTLPNADKIAGYMKNNLSLSDSYTLANRNAIIQQERQRAINGKNSFAHVNQPRAVGGEPGTQAKVSEIASWRKMGYPGTDQDIAKAIIDAKNSGEMP
jgi:hypothetical protein